MAIDAQQGELKSERTTVKRKGFRGAYDFATMARILDEALVCHVGFVSNGQPFVIPTGFGRKGRTLYVHGLSVNHMLNNLEKGVPMCFTVSIVDGLVYARSGFNHSINYRSVVVLGTAVAVEGEEKMEGLRCIMQHLVPDRWDDVRPPNPTELKATTVLKIEVTEGSAKIRSGGPIDDEEDMGIPCWAGVLPMTMVTGTPIPHERMKPDTPVPGYVTGYKRPIEAA
jgi:nitroimidazol reductase NimA-like FMN-containing flavoprotein (pyridoxamine 5'-phosphate oxidase superfamily)